MRLAEKHTSPAFLYQKVVHLISRQIQSGVLGPGDALPSLRRLSNQLDVSIPTVRQGYLELERRGQIQARPKSGYFVTQLQHKPITSMLRRAAKPTSVRSLSLLDRVINSIYTSDMVPLGIANPSMALPATKTLNRISKRVMNRSEAHLLNYADSSGDLSIRLQLAHRYLQQGMEISPKSILITNGAQEALSIALQCVAKAGDTIAVESPCYHSQLELIENLGMLALEIDTCPADGIQLDALDTALNTHRVAACLFSSALNNPLGCLTSDQQRQSLITLLERHQVPLIEDDVYGELIFDGPRPRPAYFYSRQNNVLLCNSFSKTCAPGYRTGWLLAGRYQSQALRIKRAQSCSTSLLPQLVLAEFLASGDYERYLRRLKPALHLNAQRMVACIAMSFPEGTRISQPKGGTVLWVELPTGTDSVSVFEQALVKGISLMPGAIFAAANRYKNFIRLSYGHPWDASIEAAIMTLSELVNHSAN